MQKNRFGQPVRPACMVLIADKFGIVAFWRGICCLRLVDWSRQAYLSRARGFAQAFTEAMAHMHL